MRSAAGFLSPASETPVLGGPLLSNVCWWWWCDYCCEHDAPPSRGAGSPWAERCDAALNQASLQQHRDRAGTQAVNYISPAPRTKSRRGPAPHRARPGARCQSVWRGRQARTGPVRAPFGNPRSGAGREPRGGRTPTTRRRARGGTGWIRGPRAGARWEARRSQRRVYLPPGGNGNQFQPRCGRTSPSF